MNVYISRDGEQLGAFPLDEVNSQLAKGTLRNDDLAWQEGLIAWQPLSTLPGVRRPAGLPPPIPPAIPKGIQKPPTVPGSIDQSSNDAREAILPVDDLLKVFVASNYQYYQRKWRALEEKKGRHSWNWAAFFLGMIWIGYRRMYAYAWIIIGVFILEDLCELALGFPSFLSNGINFGVAVFFGSKGNQLYKTHAERKLREIPVGGIPPEVARVQAMQKGGTSMGAAIGFALAFFVLGFLLTFV